MFEKANSLRYNSIEVSRQRLLPSSSEAQNGVRNERGCCNSPWNGFHNLVEFAKKAIKMGHSDPRKVIFAAKSGLAMAIVSLLVFWKPPFDDVSQYSIWAMLTVIVMFEFSVGATLIKGFNRGLGTFFAGIMAYGFVALSKLSGDWEDVIFVISLSLTAFVASYLKMYPTMAPYEYGFRVFVLTYCILMVAGQRTGAYSEAILSRLALIALGGVICVVVNTGIYPMWAGEDLHRLVVKNFKDLATSVQACVNAYLECLEYTRIPSTIVTYQDAEDPVYASYRAVVESKTREQTLLNFALWEPPHGRYRMLNYPWRNYAKVSGALRHCAFMVMALHGSILSEIQAPPEKREVFSAQLQKVGTEAAKVLGVIGEKMERMEKVDTNTILKQVHKAAEQLQKTIDKNLHHLVNPENWELRKQSKQLQTSQSLPIEYDQANVMKYSLSEAIVDFSSIRKLMPWPSSLLLEGEPTITEDEAKTYESASALSLATFASLLVEFVARLQNVVNSFEELSEIAKFKEPLISSHGETKTIGLWSRVLRFFGYQD